MCDDFGVASVSAFIILGGPHPNDNGIYPEWLIELWEGNRATLKLKSLTSQKRAKLFYPESSKTIFKSVNEVLEFVYPGATQKNKEPYFKALVVTCLPGSSLERDIEKFERLTRLEVHLTKKVKSRTFSQWTNNWQ